MQKKAADGRMVAVDTSLISANFNTEKWFLGEGGYYYYNRELGAGGETEPLFTEITFGEAEPEEYPIGTFSLTVQVEAVQAVNNRGAGVVAAFRGNLDSSSGRGSDGGSMGDLGMAEVYFMEGAEDFVSLSSKDLFGNFKGLMPGDTRTEKIKVKNKASDYDYVEIYLQAKPHNLETNIPEILEDDIHGDERTEEESRLLAEKIAGMEEFLSRLLMTVEKSRGNSEGDLGVVKVGEKLSLEKEVLIGAFKPGEEAELLATVKVPAMLGNEYMERAGEIDWVFRVAAYKDGEVVEYIPDGGKVVFWRTIAVLVTAAVGAGITLFVAKRRRRK